MFKPDFRGQVLTCVGSGDLERLWKAGCEEPNLPAGSSQLYAPNLIRSSLSAADGLTSIFNPFFIYVMFNPDFVVQLQFQFEA